MKVVLLHAFPLDERMWEPQQPVLAEHDVVAPRLYTLGGNSLERWAESVLGQFDGDAAVVGASMGGFVALRMAAVAPERLRGMLLAGSRIGPDPPERRTAREEAMRTLRDSGIDAWAGSAPAPPPPERTVDELIRALEAARDRPDSTEVVRSFERPLWVACGDDDPYLPLGEARQIAETAPAGRLEVFEHTGHFPNRDRPERFNALLREFLGAV